MTEPSVLPPTDARGSPLAIGSLVVIPPLPTWLTHDLPPDEVELMRGLEGSVMPVLEIDPHGYVWFGVSGPWFALRAAEVRLAGDRWNLVRRCIQRITGDMLWTSATSSASAPRSHVLRPDHVSKFTFPG